MKLNKAQMGVFEQVAQDHDADLRTTYSGRLMNGRSCIGFVTDEPLALLVNLVLALKEDDSHKNDDEGFAFIETNDRLYEILPNASMDSMGRKSIIYWNSLEAPENYQENDEDD